MDGGARKGGTHSKKASAEKIKRRVLCDAAVDAVHWNLNTRHGTFFPLALFHIL